jgi:hypothetical protein
MEEQKNKTIVGVEVWVQYEAWSTVLEDGIPTDVREKDKGLVKKAAPLGGKPGQKEFHRHTNLRDIEFIFPDMVKASGFADIVKTMPGMKVLRIVPKPGAGSPQ